MDTSTSPEATPEIKVDDPSLLPEQPVVQDPPDKAGEEPVKSEHEKLLEGIDSVLKTAAPDASSVTPESKPAEQAKPDATPEAKPDEQKPAPATPVEGDDKDDDKLDFKDHPRFIALKQQVAESKTLKTDYESKLATAHTELQPLVSLRQFLADSGVTGDEFTQGLQIMRALKTDPLAAAKLLEPTMAHLNQHTGKGDLPADLKAKVADGEISEDAAREMVRYRTEAQVAKQAAERTVQMTTSADTERLRIESMQAVAAWEENLKKTDPEYARRQELTHKLILANGKQGGPRNREEALHLVTEAYKEASRMLPKVEVAPKPATKPAPTSATSSQGRTVVTTKPKNIQDGVSQLLAGLRR